MNPEVEYACELVSSDSLTNKSVNSKAAVSINDIYKSQPRVRNYRYVVTCPFSAESDMQIFKVYLSSNGLVSTYDEPLKIERSPKQSQSLKSYIAVSYSVEGRPAANFTETLLLVTRTSSYTISFYGFGVLPTNSVCIVDGIDSSRQTTDIIIVN